MEDTIQNIGKFILQTLLSEFVVVVAGVLFALFIQGWWIKWRYGNWVVVVQKSGRQEIKRSISPAKAKEILDEPAEMAVFLKGVANPYGWIHCDLLTQGREIGLFVEDRKKRQLLIDMDKNPPDGDRREGPQPAA